MEQFLASRPEVERLSGLSDVLPGDLLGFRIYRTVHHMGIALSGPTGQVFIHALDGMGTIISSLSDATWSARLAAVWRPIDLKQAILKSVFTPLPR
jgi:cell wall-associated NlpC family hydrolase